MSHTSSGPTWLAPAVRRHISSAAAQAYERTPSVSIRMRRELRVSS
jgi:hypothetical protein